MKILICGDSYSVTDPNYPGLHWSEKILNHSEKFEICNLACGGASNGLITLQLMQGLCLSPDFVILSFTSDGRFELDNDEFAVPYELSSDSLSAYIKERYTTNNLLDHDNIKSWMIRNTSSNFEKIKNFFHISLCLQTLKQHNIPFVYTLGGFEYKQDYNALINSNYMHNCIKDFTDKEIKTNLWYHGQLEEPCFHVADDRIHTLFANECIQAMDRI